MLVQEPVLVLLFAGLRHGWILEETLSDSLSACAMGGHLKGNTMILADYQVNGQFPSKIATSGTAAVYFPRTLGTSGPGSTPATPTAANATGQLNIPGSQYGAAVNGARLRVVASGSVYVGATSNVTVVVQINTGTLATPAYTTLMSTGAVSVTGGAGVGRASWVLEGHLVLASNSPIAAGATGSDLGTGYQANFGSPNPFVQGQLSGAYFGAINGANLVDLTAIPATTNPVQWVGATPAGLVVNVTFATGNAANIASLSQFTILGD